MSPRQRLMLQLPAHSHCGLLLGPSLGQTRYGPFDVGFHVNGIEAFDFVTMDKKFQDVGKIDKWIERLMRCEYLTEAEVQELCVKVRPPLTNLSPVLPKPYPPVSDDAGNLPKPAS